MMVDNHFEPGDEVGEYTIERFIDRGNFAHVYLAWSEGLGEVALKHFIKPEIDYDDLWDEAMIMARFNHKPCFVNVYDARFIGNQYPIICMEYMKGGTLKNRLGAERHINWMDAMKITFHIAIALKTMHDGGCCHRDVKPANILFKDNTSIAASLGDFGTAIHFRNAKAALMAGTLPYMSPKILSEGYTPHSDIYSLGIVLYEMLVGKLPYKFLSPFEWERMAEEGKIKVEFSSRGNLPQEIPKPLIEIVLKATSLNNDGYQSVRELIEEISSPYWEAVSTYSTTEDEVISPLRTLDDLSRNLISLEKENTIEQIKKELEKKKTIKQIEEEAEMIAVENFYKSWEQRQQEILEGLNEDMKAVFYNAVKSAIKNRNLYVGVERLFYAFLSWENGILYQSLKKAGVNPKNLKNEIKEEMTRISSDGKNVLSPRLEQVLKCAKESYPLVGEKGFLSKALKERGYITLLIEESGVKTDEILKEVKGNEA